jgi:hypothetical protein
VSASPIKLVVEHARPSQKKTCLLSQKLHNAPAYLRASASYLLRYVMGQEKTGEGVMEKILYILILYYT